MAIGLNGDHAVITRNQKAMKVRIQRNGDTFSPTTKRESDW
jgi:hypothetical protein